MKNRLILAGVSLSLLFSILACGQKTASVTEPQPTEASFTQVATLPPEIPSDTPTENPIVIPTDMVAYYPLDGDVQDKTGNGHDGTLYNGSFGIDRYGIENHAVVFDGLYTVVEIPPEGDLDLTGSFSINFYLRGNSDYAHQWILIGKHLVQECKPGTSSWILRYHNEQGLFFSVYDQNAECGTAFAQNNPIRLDDDTWHNLSAIYEKTNQSLKFYVDCELAYETSGDMNIQANSNPLTFGNQYFGPESTAFQGTLDEIRIYSRALAEPELGAFCSTP